MRHLLLTTTAAAALLFGIAGSAGAQSERGERATGSDRPAASQSQHMPTAQSRSSMGEKSPAASSKSGQAGDSRKSAESGANRSKSGGNTGQADRSSMPSKSASEHQSKGTSAHGKAAQDRSTRDTNTGSASKEMSDTGKDNGRLGQSDERRGKSARDKKAGEKAGARHYQSPDQNTGQADRGRSGMSDDEARGDRDRSGDRNASDRMNNRGDRTGSTDRADTRSSASLSTDQRSKVRQALVRDDTRARTNVNFSVSIGAHVPDRVRVHSLPASVVEIVPQYRGYDFDVVRDEIVIVEPRTKKVVTVISKSGRHAGNVGSRSSHEGRLNLTAQQKRTIRQHVHMRPANVSGVTVAVGEEIPSSVQLETFPRVVVEDVPTVSDYRFFVMNDEIVLVDPSDREIVAVIGE